MTADRLDADTEARIRELIAKAQGTADLWNLPVLMRAAILADRAAVGTFMSQATKIRELESSEQAERAHADALAEALRKIRDPDQSMLRVALATNDCGRILEVVTHVLNVGRDIAKASLAAHDKRRG